MQVARQIKSALRPIYSVVLPAPLIAGIRKSRPVFNRARKRYFAGHPMTLKRNVEDPALAELMANGIVVLPRYFDGALIKDCHDKALSALELVRLGNAPREWETLCYADDGIYRLRRIEKIVPEVFDLRPGAIIRDLDLLRPIYAQTAAYGHFGRTDIELPWEQLNKVDDLKRAI